LVAQLGESFSSREVRIRQLRYDVTGSELGAGFEEA
jgi:hypothetical protein